MTLSKRLEKTCTIMGQCAAVAQIWDLETNSSKQKKLISRNAKLRNIRRDSHKSTATCVISSHTYMFVLPRDIGESDVRDLGAVPLGVPIGLFMRELIGDRSRRMLFDGDVGGCML